MEILLDPHLWASLLTLTVLEIILGIDNLIFISLVSNRLPASQRSRARRTGLGLAVITRLLLLAGMAWLVGLTRPLFAVFGHSVSLRDVILAAGGLFLLASPPCAGRRGAEGRRHRFSGSLVAVVCLFALIQAALPGPARGEDRKCVPTAKDTEGPFYKPGAPERRSTGSGLTVSGEVLSYPGCRPIPGARVEWWHADRSGRYVDSLRGMQKTGGRGGYAFTTSPPGVYPGRPPHIHFKVSVQGHQPLTTQLYLRGGEKTVLFDLVIEEDQGNR